MTPDNGNEDTARREATPRESMPGRASATGTPADPASYEPGEAPRQAAGTRASSEAQDAARTGNYDPTRTGQDDPTRTGNYDPTRTGQDDPTRTGQDDPTRTGQDESARARRDDLTRAGADDPTRTARGETPHGDGKGALLSHDVCDKYALRLQHAVGEFVDGPRASVEEADHVLEELTARFTDAVAQRRRTLRTSWQQAGEGESADTERLRLALRDYREVTERLLHL
ncbi:hypothetical protein [Streptomyces sp. SD15]